jgi:hypothetical protein
VFNARIVRGILSSFSVERKKERHLVEVHGPDAHLWRMWLLSVNLTTSERDPAIGGIASA